MDSLLKLRDKPKISVKTVFKKGRLGFSVLVKRKWVKDARVYCNERSYPWEFEEEGKTVEQYRKDLFAGEKPSFFFPFQVTLKDLKEGSDKSYETANVTFTEVTTNKTACSTAIIIPKNKVSSSGHFHGKEARDIDFNVSIRIIGEGIAEKKDYLLNLGLKNLNIPAISGGEPLITSVASEFPLRRKRFWEK